MQRKEVTGSADSCTVMRYLVDAEREIAIPVAVVLSDQETGRIWFRLPHEEERIEGVTRGEMMPYLELARDQIAAWHRDGTLPYAPDAPVPLSPTWWAQVRRLMQWRVRLDPTRPIDCRCAEAEIETLYAVWVQPSRGPAEPICPTRSLAGEVSPEPEAEQSPALPVSR